MKSTPKPYESRTLALAREKVTRIREVAQQHAAALEQLRTELETANAELTSAEQHDAEVLTYANAQGVPPEIAEKELDHRRGNVPKNALEMSPEQWRAHKRAQGL